MFVAALLVGGPVFGKQAGSAEFEELTGRWHGVTRDKVINERIDVSFADDDSAVVHERQTEDGRRLAIIDPAAGRLVAEVDPGIAWKSFRALPANSVLLETEEGWKQWKDGDLTDAEPIEEERRGRRDRRDRDGWTSPDGRHTVEVRDGELLLRSDDGSERVVAEEEGGEVFRDPPAWAPDSSRFAIWRTRDVEERIVHYIESAPDDQLQPKHFTNSYPKPGDEIDTRAPWVFYADGREPLAPDMSLIENPYQCRRLDWRGDSRRLTFEYVERGFGKHRIIEIDSEERGQRVLVNEESETFVFVSGVSYRRDLNDGSEILWMSERDGWRHLYLLDGLNGTVKRQLTKGEWVVRRVENVDEEAREVTLEISGCYPDQDPYLIHFARVSIDTGEMVKLTSSPGTHDRFERSPGGKYFTCRWSRVDHPPVTELRRWEDGSLVLTLAEADASALRDAGWPLPEPFVAKDREGKFDIHGIIIRPPEFDPAKKYAVIENIYAGPQGSFVPKSWRPWMMPKHEIAVHGFIVVQIDGRGTFNRSKEFHDECYKNLKDAGLPDRIAWLKAAAERYPQLDLERVGIFGGSAGGQSALGALLFHGDFYKAAAADCGCHDNRIDKLWWNEQWMDWPIGPEYADNSNVTHAGKLEGALLLTVGEVDTNVDPASTYQVIDALIAADKDFDFLPMTGRNHGSGEQRYAQRRRLDFFMRELGVPVPR